MVPFKAVRYNRQTFFEFEKHFIFQSRKVLTYTLFKQGSKTMCSARLGVVEMVVLVVAVVVKRSRFLINVRFFFSLDGAVQAKLKRWKRL